MSAEWFAKLKEYDSLSKARLTHLQVIKEQEERINKLSLHKTHKNEEVSALKSSFLKLQSEMAEKENQIKSLSEQRQRLLDYGGDEKKITDLSQKIAQLENEGFEVLEALEQNELAREEAKTFLTGLEKTIAEISSEADQVISVEKKGIEQMDLRLKLLQEELPKDFQERLKKVLAKNLAHGPFSRIEQGSCYFCRYKISRIDESEVEIQKQLKNCPQCSRIFIPYGT